MGKNRFLEMFEAVMDEIKGEYPACKFFTERDFVWIVQKEIKNKLDEINESEDRKCPNEKCMEKKCPLEKSPSERSQGDKNRKCSDEPSPCPNETCQGKDKKCPYVVYNDYPILPCSNRSGSVDLAIVKKGVYKKCYKAIREGKARAEFVAEFKFEPSKEREGIQPHKGNNVISWKGVIDDIIRIKRFVGKDENEKTVRAETAVAVFIDEFGFTKDREEKDREWEDWRWKHEKELKEKTIGGILDLRDWGDDKDGKLKISVLWTEFHADAK